MSLREFLNEDGRKVLCGWDLDRKTFWGVVFANGKHTELLDTQEQNVLCNEMRALRLVMPVTLEGDLFDDRQHRRSTMYDYKIVKPPEDV